MNAAALSDRLVTALQDLKGQNILSLDVASMASFTDYMILVSGTSNRHVKALVDKALEAAKNSGETVIGVEGREANEWVLLDLGDVIVHVMQKDAREFYALERLWTQLSADSESVT